ncbi:SAM-dependent methyltransferase [Sphingomonas baiyangensis]|uniref:SAM-dependent methyltransferase n=1 Tax=Sphingomonas baiyangensis TaxID=2572576 RepID=UPI001BB0BE40|nr:methyltransferase domain-containing protein [Sphingomonas baiyangensis]
MRGLAIVVAALLLGGCATAIPRLADGSVAAGEPARTPDVYYEPSPPEVVEAMLKLANVGPGDVVYDLGSGDGRIPIAAARDFGARGVGIEIDPRLVAVARENAAQAGVGDRVTFRGEDFFEADLSGASVVTLFLFPSINRRLAPRLLAQLKPGSRVIGHYHAVPGWTPDARIRVRGRPLYRWTIPVQAGATN